jgi:hypothetical protein
MFRPVWVKCFLLGSGTLPLTGDEAGRFDQCNRAYFPYCLTFRRFFNVIQFQNKTPISMLSRTVCILFLFVFGTCVDRHHNRAVSKQIKYGVYTWFEKADSLDFRLLRFIKVDTDGHYMLMRYDNVLGKSLYFSG